MAMPLDSPKFQLKGPKYRKPEVIVELQNPSIEFAGSLVSKVMITQG